MLLPRAAPRMRQWSDHFIHPALRDDAERLRRARLTVLLSAVLVGIALGYALFYGAVVGYAAGARILLLGAAGAAASLVLLRVRPWQRAGANLSTVSLYGVIVGLMTCEGGVTALATPLLSTPTVLAILLLGRRAAAGWTALAVGTIAAFGVAEAHGVHFPIRYPAEWAARMQVGSPVGVVLCTALLLFVFESVRADTQARADAATAALARLAYQDALTGLANRAHFRERLSTALAAATAAGDPARVAVLMLDLDGFKAVNDTLGHAAGDALLAEVAARLLNATRGCDTVARLGGDEFAVLLAGVRRDADAAVVAERIVGALAAPFALAAGEARVGTSLGVARGLALDPYTPAAPAGGVPPDAAAVLLHHADLALYRAKAAGRGQWVPFDPGMLVGAPTPSTGGARRTPRRAQLEPA